ncbi:MAG: hypothetical protein H7A35_04195 [Planctomycetales bacterium]|nr:hypothetical protein [bacterium]UNM09257.1 MAG: hypothetical protein H7A35_04195 [Planctomycetales bacterium]
MPASGYSYKMPRHGGGKVRRNTEPRRPLSCCCLSPLIVLLLAGGALWYWQPAMLGQLRQDATKLIGQLLPSEPEPQFNHPKVNYKSDPNKFSQGALDVPPLSDSPALPGFRELLLLEKPQSIDGRLSRLKHEGQEYLFTAMGANDVQFIGPEGPLSLPYSITPLDGSWQAGWDFNRDGRDEVVPLFSLESIFETQLPVPEYLWSGMMVSNATVVEDENGQSIKVLHGLPDLTRQEFIPAVDVDGDGWKELVLTDTRVGDERTKFLVYGYLGEKRASLLVERDAYFAGVSDTNGDGGRELILFDRRRELVVALSLKGGSRVVLTPLPFADISAMPDLNGDGISELVDSGRAWWDPVSGSYVELEPALGSKDPDEVKRLKVLACDLDSDGRRELIIFEGQLHGLERMAVYAPDGKAQQLVEFDDPLVDAAVLSRGQQEFLVLAGRNGLWSLP